MRFFLTFFVGVLVSNSAFSARTLCTNYTTIQTENDAYDGSPAALVTALFKNNPNYPKWPEESFADHESTDPNGCPGYSLTTNSAPDFIYTDGNDNFLFRARGRERRSWTKYGGQCIQKYIDINETAAVKDVAGQKYLDGAGVVCITIFPKDEKIENLPPAEPWKVPKINLDNNKICKPDLYTPNPVFLPTGVKFLQAMDFEDQSPHSLTLTRFYFSDRSISEKGLGKWRHAFDESIEHYGPASTGKEYIIIHLASEGDIQFQKQNGQWVNPSGVGAGSLIFAEDEWVFTSKVGVQRRFSKIGKLIRRTEINGWAYDYYYSDYGELLQVKNQFGRTLKFEQDPSDHQRLNVYLNDQPIVSYFHGYGQLDRVFYPDGASVSYVYSNDLTEIWDELDVKSASYTYDSAGRVASTQFAGGLNKYQISYPGAYASTAVVTDPLGMMRTYKFSGRNSSNVSSSSAPGSQIRRFVKTASMNSEGLPIEDYDFNGNRNAYSWDYGRDLLLTKTEAQNSSVERSIIYEWHPLWRVPVKITEPGRITTYSYNDRGNPLSQTVKDSATGTARITSWTYHSSGLVATEIAPNKAITKFQYDSSGNLTTVINPLGHTEKFTYDPAGRVLTHLSPAKLATTYSYDLRGRMLTVNRGGLLTTLTYRPNGLIATATLAHGYVITYSYDQARRLTGWSDNRGGSGSYVLDNMGNRLSEEVRDSEGKLAWKLARSINSLNRVASIQVGSNAATTSYTYDANGDLINATQTQAGIQSTAKITMDPLRRIKILQDANNASAAITYNARDDITKASDFKGISTNYTRDAFGKASKEASLDIGSTTTAYDYLGLAQKVKDGLGRTVNITRDALGRATRLQYSDATSTVLRYDLTGASYNAPGTPQASVGHLSEIRDPDVITTYQRDLLGRITQKTQTLLANGDTRTLEYSYHPIDSPGAGLVNTITYASGKQLAHVYDSTGRLTALHWNGEPLITGITSSPLGEPTGWHWPKFPSATNTSQPLIERRIYNDAGQLASSALFDITWDGAGRISKVTQQHMLPSASATVAQSVALSSAYTYDRVGRLTASAHSPPSNLILPPGWSISDVIGPNSMGYSYDANANRVQAFYSTTTQEGVATLERNVQVSSGTNRVIGFSQTYKPAGSSTSEKSTVSYQLDASGALTKKGEHYLHQSVQGRIAKISLEADPTHVLAVGYTYNSLSQRLFKIDTRLSDATPITEQTVYADDALGSTVLGLYGNQRSASSAAPTGVMDSTEIIYLPTARGPMPVAAEINGRIYAIHSDHLNTPRRLTNIQGQVAWQWLVAGFGEVQPTSGSKGYALNGIDNGRIYSESVIFNLRYPGQQWDEQTQLSYNLNRYYDAATGRYIQPDPIGLDGGWNRFAYVGGNPLLYTDPMGLQAIPLPPVVPIPGVSNPTLDAQRNLVDRLNRTFTDDGGTTYQTYTRYNPLTGDCYSGRTSGADTPENNVRNRGYGQPLLNAEGFLPPVLDRSSTNYSAIRGREQQLIDLNGGARSSGGTSRNMINGISPINPRGPFVYIPAATAEFGMPMPAGKCTCQ